MGAGKVYVIGAGPGSPDLISVRGYRALLSAEVVLVDRLLPRTFLEELGIPTAGKVIELRGNDGPCWSQNEINAWLVSHARAGRIVVHLKGGDPFVFGRTDEEIDYLSAHQILWEVVPGSSSATAALTSAGLPLTRRGVGRSFAVATARLVGGAVQRSFPRSDSLVILMAVGVLDLVVARLLADGWSPDTPAAVVERGTLPWERRVAAPLCRLDRLAKNAGVAPPATVIVGSGADSVFSVRERPTILFTGLDPTKFRPLGNLLHWPALKIVPDDEGKSALPWILEQLDRRDFDWIVFSSQPDVTSFLTTIAEQELDGRVLAGTRIAATRTETALRLREHGLRADAALADGTAAEIVRALGWVSGESVLVVKGGHAPRDLCARLEEAGASATHLSLHKLVSHPELGRPLPDHDAICFVSPCAVRAYWNAYGSAAFQHKVWCASEATRSALARHDIEENVLLPNVTAELTTMVPAK